MYKDICIALDTTATDRAIIEHILPLAKKLGSRVTLLHVLDGWAARRFGADAVSPELAGDEAYLNAVKAECESRGVTAHIVMAYGDPVKGIVNWVRANPCDLLAMSTHGHSPLESLVLGRTASRVQRELDIPVLMLRAGGDV